MRTTKKRAKGRSLRVLLLTVVLAALALGLFAGSALAGPPWSDAPNSWWVASYNLTETQVFTVAAGFDDGTFRPALAVNRAQFAKMVVDGFSLGTSTPAVATFRDVPLTNYYSPWIEGGVHAGIISGYDDDTFRPGTTVSRQQANSMLGLFLSQKEVSLTGHIRGSQGIYGSLSAWYGAEGAGVLAGFADAGSLLPVHAPTTAYLVYHGVVQGSAGPGGVFLDPKGSLARAQAVALILRVKSTTFITTGLHLHVTGITNPVTAGAASGVTVTVVDEANSLVTGYTGTIHFTSTDPFPATLPADYKFTAADSGMHTFAAGVILKTAGSQTVTATDTVTATITGAQTVTVNPGVVAKFSVTMSGGTTPLSATAKTAGTPFSVRVTAQDQYGNTVTGYTGTVDLTSNAFSGHVYATITTSGRVDGVVITPTVEDTERTIRASDGTITTVDASGPFTVTAKAAKFAVTMSGGTTPLSAAAKTAGVRFSVRVTAQDQYGNTVTSYTGDVQLTSNAFSGHVHAYITTNGRVDGVVITPTVAGTARTISASDGTITTVDASGPFTVNPGALNHFIFDTITSPKSTDTAFSITLTAYDAYDNVVTTHDLGGSGSTHIDFTTTHSGATVTAGTPIHYSDFTSGVYSGNVTISHSGGSVSLALVATSAASGHPSGTSNSFTLSTPPDHFEFDPIVGPETAGVAFSVTITAKDASDNVMTSYTGPAVLSASTGGGTVSPTSFSFSGGVGTHNVTLTKAGANVHLTITDGAVHEDSTSFVVNAGLLNHFHFATISGTKTAGVPFSITLTAVDAYNNVVDISGPTEIDFTTTHAGATVMAGTPIAYSHFASGVYSGSITLNHPGGGVNLALVATSAAPGHPSGTSNTFRLNPGP